MLFDLQVFESYSTRIIASALAAMLLTATPALAADPSQSPMRTAMMDEMMGMKKGMGDNQAGGAMTGMSPQSSGNSKDKGMGCCMGMMGQSPAMSLGMQMQSALPGFPGASHLYHVGGTGFFLDYADKLSMTTEQRTTLNDIKQQALIQQSASDRKIEEAEQALWLLTAAEQPDAAAIEAKLHEIGKLNVDRRLSLIRAVGEASKVLTQDQRKMVLGMVAMPSAAPAKQTH
jgi:Spy/CpxP family protein refolding chaperone